MMPNGAENGSRQIIKLQLNTSREGWNNLAVRWEATSILNPERNIDNNLVDYTLWVNSAPVIEDIFCDSSQFVVLRDPENRILRGYKSGS